MDSKIFILEGGLKQTISFCWYSSVHVQNLISTVPQHGYKEIIWYNYTSQLTINTVAAESYSHVQTF